MPCSAELAWRPSRLPAGRRPAARAPAASSFPSSARSHAVPGPARGLPRPGEGPAARPDARGREAARGACAPGAHACPPRGRPARRRGRTGGRRHGRRVPPALAQGRPPPWHWQPVARQSASQPSPSPPPRQLGGEGAGNPRPAAAPARGDGPESPMLPSLEQSPAGGRARARAGGAAGANPGPGGRARARAGGAAGANPGPGDAYAGA